MLAQMEADRVRPEGLVRLNAQPRDKSAAIAEVGQLLVAAGCAEPGFEASMLRREAVANTYLGAGVAIPHGLGEDKGLVLRDGIAVLQVPGGVEWNPGQTARLIVGIAARSDAHIAILRRLTRLLQDETRLEALFQADDASEILEALSRDTAPTAPSPAAGDLAETARWVVDYPTGLHARPASAWAEAAKASGVRLQVRKGGEAADARSLVALLQLGLLPGEEVVFSAAGQDAAGALARFLGVVKSLSAQEKADAARSAERAKPTGRGWTPQGPAKVIGGVGASPGLVIARLHVVTQDDGEVPDHPVPLDQGATLLNTALVRTREQLTALVDDTARRLGAADAAIFKAHTGLLDDTDLITLTCQLMVAGHGVAWAWNSAVERMAGQLSALGNPVLAARAADLRDVGRRVLLHIDPTLGANSLTTLPDTPCILVATDLSPSDTAGLDPQRVAGLATAQGGPTSHTAILARTLGLPAMVAGGADVLEAAAGTLAILDGDSGRLYLDPTPADVVSAQAWIEAQAVRRAEEAARRALPARTRDGHQVAIGANVNRPDQVAGALAQGGEGVGLMRTEFLFLERGETPDEDAQYEVYRDMLQALGGRPLIVRTLDVGGDKQVAHLNLPREANPFLGVRGARLLLRRRDLLEPQLRALYRAARDHAGELSIMFPMITSVSEVLTLRAECERVRTALDAPVVPVGVMIEVPAAAILADRMAAHVDFFSIGTNDLTQYTLAIDRQNPDLAPEADSLHPAVLRLIAQTVAGARSFDRWVGVCGGLAGEPFGAKLLTGLGVSELSMTPRDIAAVKARLRDSDHHELKRLASLALECETAAEVRALDEVAP